MISVIIIILLLILLTIPSLATIQAWGLKKYLKLYYVYWIFLNHSINSYFLKQNVNLLNTKTIQIYIRYYFINDRYLFIKRNNKLEEIKNESIIIEHTCLFLTFLKYLLNKKFNRISCKEIKSVDKVYSDMKKINRQSRLNSIYK